MDATVEEAETPAAEQSPQLAVKTLAKALSLLDWVGKGAHPPTISELALSAGLSRPTTHRLVQTLLVSGFLQQSAIDGRLSIGYAILPLAARLLDTNRLRIESLPHLEALAQKTNGRVNLGIRHQHKIMILAGGEKPSLPTIHARFGRTVPMHCCALGKATLALLSPDEVRAIAAEQPLLARTPHTITSIPALLADLEKIRERGYATEFRENTLTSCCVAVPVLDAAGRPVAAISVAGRSLEQLDKEVEHLLQTAELISHLVY